MLPIDFPKLSQVKALTKSLKYITSGSRCRGDNGDCLRSEPLIRISFSVPDYHREVISLVWVTVSFPCLQQIPLSISFIQECLLNLWLYVDFCFSFCFVLFWGFFQENVLFLSEKHIDQQGSRSSRVQIMSNKWNFKVILWVIFGTSLSKFDYSSGLKWKKYVNYCISTFFFSSV